MIRLLAAALLLTGSTGVTQQQFDAIQPRENKAVVEQSFGTTGEVIVEWYGGTGWAHRWKDYPTNDGRWVQILYSHAPDKKRWHVQVHRGKAVCPEERTPCTEGWS